LREKGVGETSGLIFRYRNVMQAFFFGCLREEWAEPGAATVNAVVEPGKTYYLYY